MGDFNIKNLLGRNIPKTDGNTSENKSISTKNQATADNFGQTLMNELTAGISEFNYLKTGENLKYSQSYNSQTHNLQKHLIQLGYMNINELRKPSGQNEFGFFGPKTARSVMQLQKNAGIKVDGIVGPQTKKVLTAMLEDKGLMGAVGVNPEAPLDIGSTGKEVAYLQDRLTHLGFYRDTIDGIYGPLTYRAVWLYKEANGLTGYPGNNNGTAGMHTLKILMGNRLNNMQPYKPDENPVEMHLMDVTERKKYLKEIAANHSMDTGVSPELIYAVACVESSAGRYVPTMGYKTSRNLFGIKDFGKSLTDYQGTNGFTMNTTREFISSRGTDRSIDINARFRAYNSYEESVKDFVSLMHSPLYRDKVINNNNLGEIAEYLEGLYSTNTGYSEKLKTYFSEYDTI